MSDYFFAFTTLVGRLALVRVDGYAILDLLIEIETEENQ